MITYVLA
jgi:hypothetical protein